MRKMRKTLLICLAVVVLFFGILPLGVGATGGQPAPCAHVCGTEEECTGDAATCPHAQHTEDECASQSEPCAHACGAQEPCTGDAATCPHAGHEAGTCVQEQPAPVLHTLRFFATLADVTAGVPIATASVADGATLAADAFPGPAALGLAEGTEVTWRMAEGGAPLLPGTTALTYETATVVDVYAEVAPSLQAPPVKAPAAGIVVTADGEELASTGNGRYKLPAAQGKAWYDAEKACYYLPDFTYAFNENTSLEPRNITDRITLFFIVPFPMASAHGLPSVQREVRIPAPRNQTVILPGAEVFANKLGDLAVLGWTLVGTNTQNVGSTLYTAGQAWGELRLEPQLGNLSYQVTFALEGGAPPQGTPATAYAPQTVAEGGKVQKPADPVKAGYLFEGWFAGGEKWDFAAGVNGDLALVARWARQGHTVAFDLAGGTPPQGTLAAAYDAQSVADGNKAQRPVDPVKQGYLFEGWYAGAEAWNFTAAVKGDLTLKALWTKAHTVAFDLAGGAPPQGTLAAAYDTQSVADGISAQKPADPEREGYLFGGWYAGDEEWNFGAAVKGNLALKAAWTKAYTVTCIDPLSADAPHTEAYAQNIPVTVEALTRSGYVFAGWQDEDGDTYVAGLPFAMPAEDLALTAQWRFEPDAFSVAGFDKVYDGTAAATSLGGAPAKGDVITYAWDNGAHSERYVVGTDQSYDFTRTDVVNARLTVTIERAGVEPFVIEGVPAVIAPRPVLLTAHSGGPYLADTTSYAVSGFTVERQTDENPHRGLLPGHLLSGIAAGARGYIPGTYPVAFSGSPVVTDAAGGRNLASNYSFETVEGTMVLQAQGAAPQPAARRPEGAAPPPPTAPAEGTPTAVAAAPAGQPDAPAEGVPAAQEEIFAPQDVPVTTRQMRVAGGWSLVNLLIAVLSPTLAVLLLIGLLPKNGDRQGEAQQDKSPKKRGLVWRALAVLAGVMAPVTFLLFGSLEGPMVILNALTPWLAAMLLVQLAAVLLLKWTSDKKEEHSEA